MSNLRTELLELPKWLLFLSKFNSETPVPFDWTYINRIVKWAEEKIKSNDNLPPYPMSLRGIFAWEINKQAQQGYVIHPALQEKLDSDMAEISESIITCADNVKCVVMDAALHMSSQYSRETQGNCDNSIARCIYIAIQASISWRVDPDRPNTLFANITFEVESDRRMAQALSRFDTRGGS